MKCRRCREHAVIELRQHNAAFCRECFLRHCRIQVERAIAEHEMIADGERCLIGISGGKDSLALWDILRSLNVTVDGLYLDLGIGGYSERSKAVARAFALERNINLAVVDIRAEFGFDIPTGASTARRPACSVCGISKRHLLNTHAVDNGYEVLATGHNLDDESATLLGNLLHWQIEYVGRQGAVLPERPGGFARKIKPLIRLGEKETAAYCLLSKIDYVVEECPMVGGNTGLRYKAALALLETNSPGTRQQFLAGFYAHGKELFADPNLGELVLVECGGCSSPTPAVEVGQPRCAFCATSARARSGSIQIGPNRGDRGQIPSPMLDAQ